MRACVFMCVRARVCVRAFVRRYVHVCVIDEEGFAG